MSLALRLPRIMHLARSSSNAPCLQSFLDLLQNPHVLLTFDKVPNPLRLPRETTSERPRVVQACSVLTFDLEMCFAHLCATTACTFSTSQLQKVLRTWCALYVLTWKRASRHKGVHFRHLQFKKCSEPGVLCTF